MKTSRILIGMVCVALVILVPLLARRAADARKEQATLSMMRELAATWFVWLSEQVVEDPESRSGWVIRPGSVEEPETALAGYLAELPREDGWGNPLDIRVGGERSGYGYRVSSSGPDGVFTPSLDRPFSYADCGDDIVWADGFFVCYPKSIRLN